MATRYDPIQDNFYTYEAVETPKVTLDLPLINDGLDISDWSIGFAKNNNQSEEIIQTPLAKGTRLAQAIFNNREPSNPMPQQPVQQETPKSNQSIKLTESSPQLRAKEFFVKKGLSPHIAAGIVGNLMVESGGLNPTAVGDNGSAYGLAQWRLDRRKNLENFAKEKGKDISDFDTQLEFLWHELNGNYKRVLNKLLGAKDVIQATDIFMRDYEVPNLKRANFKRRVAYANSLV